MRRRPVVFFAVLLGCGLLAGVGSRSSVIAGAAGTGFLRDNRRAGTDLEIGSPGRTWFISYEDLLKLPQVSYTVSDDSNFSGTTQVSGVALEEFAKLTTEGRGEDMIVAICNDKYRANYPHEYLAAHHPLLVLKVNGKPPSQWPLSHDKGPMGPYLISNPPFTPSFQVLSHRDEAQIPYGVVRLELRRSAEVFGAIRPRGEYPLGSAVWQGYRIAEQNCYRCHNMVLEDGKSEGGQMARHPWQVLAAWAAYDPKHFAAYVRNPRSAGADRTMPAMTEYDDRTIEALGAYFATFAVRPGR